MLPVLFFHCLRNKLMQFHDLIMFDGENNKSNFDATKTDSILVKCLKRSRENVNIRKIIA